MSRQPVSEYRHRPFLMIRAIRLALLFLAAVISGCKTMDDVVVPAYTAQNPAPTGRISFVQITDPHLFDAGDNQHGERIDAEALDNRAAFHWAVLTTNRLELSEPVRIDFAVITGDFGLWNVTMPDRNGQAAKKCECPRRTPGDEGPISAVPLREAAAEMARELDALVVREVFLVPGNSDLCAESPLDLHRWAEFVFELNQALKERETRRTQDLQNSEASAGAVVSARKPPHVVDLTYSLERLYNQGDPRIQSLYPAGKGPGPVPEPPSFSGISLLGLDSSYFKPHPARPDGSNPLQQAAERASGQEFQFVRDRIVAGRSYLLFTHVPDMEDPYRGPGPATKSDGATGSDPRSLWKLTAQARSVWHDRIIARSEILAVFAGHFHSSNRNLYPHNFNALPNQPDPIIASKFWIAPPLGAGHQETIPPTKTARGLLLVHVTTDAGVRVSSRRGEVVDPEPVWFSTLDQETAAEGDDKLTEARALELDHDWEGAAAQYKAALTVRDPRVRNSAQVGFESARAVMRAWWWKLGKWFPPFRWWHFYPQPTLIGALVVLLLLLSPRLFRGVGLLGWTAKLLKFIFMPKFRGKARVITPVSLATNSPTALFAAQIPLNALEVRRRWERAGLSFLSGGTTLLSLPSAIADEMVQNFPQVYGVNLGKYLAFVISATRYLTWRVESQLAYYPSPNATQTPPPPARMYAFASLRWGWFTQSSFKVSPKAKDALDSDKAAYAVAARILAAPWSYR